MNKWDRFLVLVTIAVCMSVSSAATSVAGVPHGTKSLTPTGRSTVRSALDLLAGSDTDLVYKLQPQVVDQLGPSRPVTPSERLFAWSSTGALHVLGVAPRDDAGFSTLRHLVSAPVDHAGASTNQVDVWTISKDVVRRRLRLPSGDVALGTGPNGVVYVDGDSLRLRGVAGADTDYGTPFPGHAPLSVATYRGGLVVTDAVGDVAAMRYSDPGTYQPLDSGTVSPIRCMQVDAEGAACLADNAGQNVRFVPLDGGTPTTNDTEFGDQVALSGSTILWTDGEEHDDLFSQAAGQPQVRAASDNNGSYSFDLVGAYGHGVVSDTSHEDPNVREGNRADDLSTLLRVPWSPETAGGFALTRQRVAYVSDLRSAKDPQQLTRVRSTTIGATANRVTIGRTTDVAGRHGSDQVVPALLAASGSNTLYEVGRFIGFDHVFNAQLRVATPRRTVTLHPSYDGGFVGLSGDWVVYSSNNRVLVVHNLRTGRTQRLFKGWEPHNAALAGNYLAYISQGGRVVRRNLRTGRVTEVSQLHRRIFSGLVVAHADWVGWNVYVIGSAAGPKPSHIHQVRNVRTGRTIHLSHEVYALNDQGALLCSPRGSAVGLTASPITTWFRPFTGGLHPLLSKRRYDEAPQLVGHALAWVADDGDLRIAPYRY